MCSSTPDVSVVIPAYRGGPLLRQAVQSMVDQSFENLEVLVVSDGSDDPMEDLEVLDVRVRVIRGEHRGVSAARNIGLLESRGTFVAFLDEDDLAMVGRVAAQFAALSDRPDAAIAYGQVQVIDEAGHQVGPLRGGPITYLDMLRARFLHMTSLMVRRREAIIAGGFDALLITGEDIDFQLRLAKDHAMVFIPEVLTRYRLHSDNTKIDPLMAQQAIGPILRAHWSWATQRELPEVVLAAADGMRSNRRNNAAAAYRQAEQAWKDGRFRESSRYLVMSVKIDPRVALKVALRTRWNDLRRIR
jgi:glycosyltransferase involved in cell wall biosynthesis